MSCGSHSALPLVELPPPPPQNQTRPCAVGRRHSCVAWGCSHPQRPAAGVRVGARGPASRAPLQSGTRWRAPSGRRAAAPPSSKESSLWRYGPVPVRPSQRGCPEGGIGMAVHHRRRRGGVPPLTPPPQGFALKEGGTPLPSQHSSYNSSQRHAPDPNITPNRFSNRQ